MDLSRRIRVFVSSPGDVEDEHNQLNVVVQELNSALRALVPDPPTAVELIRWKTHVHPGMGPYVQAVVSGQIPPYDVYLGIMWSRFGTPTGVAGSGTEEEFLQAYAGWHERQIPSHILFYFCLQDLPEGVGPRATAQSKKVGKFRQSLVNMGGLVWNYPSHAEFSETVRPHLVSVIGEIIHAGKKPSGIEEHALVGTLKDDDDTVLERIGVLAEDYRTVRLRMERGDERTRRMEVIASRMRTFGQSAVPLLSTLAGSNEPGMRLAAIQVLQAVPDARWLDWLADRLEDGVEKPFVGYHAAVALSIAARDLEDANVPEIRVALARAKNFAARLGVDTDRAKTLEYAEEELRRRRPVV